MVEEAEQLYCCPSLSVQKIERLRSSKALNAAESRQLGNKVGSWSAAEVQNGTEMLDVEEKPV